MKLAQFIIFEHCQQNLTLPTITVSHCYSSTTDRCNSLLQTWTLLVSRNCPLSSVLSTCNVLVYLWLHKNENTVDIECVFYSKGLRGSLTILIKKYVIWYLVAGNIRNILFFTLTSKIILITIPQITVPIHKVHMLLYYDRWIKISETTLSKVLMVRRIERESLEDNYIL